MAKKAKQLITTIGQLMDAIVKDRADTVSVPGGQFSHLDATIRRCWRHYGAVPKDGALLRGIDAVAEHRGCLAYLVRRMTLEEFNSALDEVFTPPPPPADPEPPAVWWAAKDARKLLGFGSQKELTVWLDQHSDVRTRRKPTKKGTPDPHRPEVEILTALEAISRDVVILDDPLRMERIRSIVAKAGMEKQLERATLEAFGFRK